MQQQRLRARTAGHDRGRHNALGMACCNVKHQIDVEMLWLKLEVRRILCVVTSGVEHGWGSGVPANVAQLV